MVDFTFSRNMFLSQFDFFQNAHSFYQVSSNGVLYSHTALNLFLLLALEGSRRKTRLFITSSGLQVTRTVSKLARSVLPLSSNGNFAALYL